MRWNSTLRMLAAVGLLFAAACDTAPADTAPGSEPALQAAPGADAATLDRQVPGFGGFYLDRGIPTVYLTDVQQRAAAEAALASQGHDPSLVQVRKADFSFAELEHWRGRLSPEALDMPGVVFVDADESINRVVVAVEHPGAAAAVRGAAARLGVPEGAVVVTQTEPIHFVATLRDIVRPVVGGLQIRFSGFLCSLSYNAVRGGVAGFVTAAHCSDQQGSVDGTQYFQPLDQVPEEHIGTEIADPSFFRHANGCPRGRKCRFSDVNFSDGDNGVSFTLGGIAQTTGPNNGSLVIAGQFSIVGEGPSAVGQSLSKVGRTTGWTQGTVTRTCVDTGVSGSNIVLLCQDFVENAVQIVAGGDSGSPVFGITSGSQVTLRGTLWGGNGSGTLLVYSPIANVERELGPLTTH